ncbi:MAG: enoyl-CoA hydratase/isomerase family protein [Actinobacteria bacterium]|nr:enoyl-CoA hydratase/isomerase family protein [Actinomycetota bacterium]
MTTASFPAELLVKAGLPRAEAEGWAAETRAWAAGAGAWAAEGGAWAAEAPPAEAEPPSAQAQAPATPPDSFPAEGTPHDSFPAAAADLSRFLARGQALASQLPVPTARTSAQGAAGKAIAAALHGARDRFLRSHAAVLYDTLTSGCTKPLRLYELVDAAAARVPGLAPSPAETAAERARALADKEGAELATGLLLTHLLALPRAGRHLVTSMLQPTPAALERLGELQATGTVSLGPVRVTRQGRAGLLELSNPRHLNAEDHTTLGATEAAVDLILLDPAIEVGVFRGGVVEHQRQAGRRVFGSGINLTHLYQGRIDYLFYLVRDMGYVNKIYRGVLPGGGGPGPGPAGIEPDTIEKLWIAAVEEFAIGGACQLLHVVDHVIAGRGARLFLPARREGIIPGASNLRLPRFVGDRAARQAILSGREWTAGEPDAAPLCDEVVDPAEMDQAVAARAEALTSSGLVNAAANRRTLRAGQEPLETFREYMATYAREQVRCHLSPALVRNLEEHWRARDRSL